MLNREVMFGDSDNPSAIDIDEVSAVYNRHYMKGKLAETADELFRNHTPFSVALLDIDYFKDINDTFGHPKGDEVIRAFAQFLVRSLRLTDRVVRYGGDEFLCFLVAIGPQEAELLLKRLLRQCPHRHLAGLLFTFSAGLASSPEHSSNLEELVELADQALYDAKRSGRACLGHIGQKRLEVPIRDFIDRQVEKERLHSFLLDTSGTCRLAVVRGHVGVGKTRLVREVMLHLARQEILWANCIAFAEDLAYYPLRELVKYKLHRQGPSVLEGIPGPYLAELGKLVPELTLELRDRLVGIEPVLDRYRLYEGIKRLLEVGQYPQVIVLDNVQWMDRDSPEVLKYLLRTMTERQTRFILIYRQEEQTAHIEELLEYVGREIEVLEMDLQPFDRTALEIAARSMLGEDGPEALIEYLWTHSGGNPYYLEELTRALHDGGFLFLEGAHWRFIRPGEELVPQKAREVTLRKYRNLPRESQQVLRIASAIGHFDLPMLVELTGFNEGHVTGCVDTISRQGLIREHRGRLFFAEEVSRQAIYLQTVTGLAGQELHRRIGRILEEYFQGREEQNLDELAFHFTRGRDRRKGVHYAIRAAEQAQRIYANREALRHIQSAIELLDAGSPEDNPEWLDCLLKRAQILLLMSDYETLDRELEQGLAIARDRGDSEREARLLVEQASALLYRGRFQASLECAHQAALRFREHGNLAGAAQALIIVALANFRLGKPDIGLQIGNQALELARSTGDRQAEARALNAIGLIHGLQGKRNQAVQDYQEALDIYRQIGDQRGMTQPTINIGNLFNDLKQYEKAREHYQAALAIQRSIGHIQGAAISLNNLGESFVREGQYAKAQPLLQEALHLTGEVGDEGLRQTVLEYLGLIHQHEGRPLQAEDHFQQALAIAREIGDRVAEAQYYSDLAQLRLEQGQRQDALSFLLQARSLYDQMPLLLAKVTNLLAIARLELELQEVEAARECLEQARQAAEEIGDLELRIEVSGTLCDFHRALGNETDLKSSQDELEKLNPDSLPA